MCVVIHIKEQEVLSAENGNLKRKQTSDSLENPIKKTHILHQKAKNMKQKLEMMVVQPWNDITLPTIENIPDTLILTTMK